MEATSEEANVGSASGSAASSSAAPAPREELWDLDAALSNEAEAELEQAEQILAIPVLQDEEQEEATAGQARAAESRPAPPRIKRLIGLRGFDVAPNRGSGSKCYLCQAQISKMSVRFDYQFSESGKMSRYIHPECCSLIPEKGRANSLNFLRQHADSDVAGEQIQSAITVPSSM